MATPGMGLSQPIPSSTNGIGVAPPGQSWGEQYNANFFTLDQHTHAPGSGSPVPTAGISINADLPFGGFNATSLRSARFSPIALGSLAAPDLGCLLVSGTDLYFVDGAGNQVRITSGGGIAGTPGSVTGLASPAAVTYTVGSKLFTFTSSSPRVAGIACGPLTIGDASADNGKQVTISAPAGLAANFALTLPPALPGTNGLLSISTTGALSVFGTLSGSDLTLAGALAVQGAAGLALTGSTGGNSVVKTTGAGLGLALQGNVAAGAGGADVVLGSTATRTAGFLAAVQNAGANKLFVDFQGLLALASQAGPIQPASLWTALVPDTGWTAQDGFAYWKDANGVVHLKGGAKNTTGGSATGFLNANPLPAGFRPGAFRYYLQSSSSTSGLVPNIIQIDASGHMILQLVIGNNGDVRVDGITFLAEG